MLPTTTMVTNVTMTTLFTNVTMVVIVAKGTKCSSVVMASRMRKNCFAL